MRGGQIKDNVIYKWNFGIKNAGSGFSVTGNKFTQSASGFSDPNRLLDKYNSSIGRANSFDSFIGAARQQARGAWDARYTAKPVASYVRAGFNAGTVAGTSARGAVAAPSPVAAPEMALPVSSTVRHATDGGPATLTDGKSIWSEQQIESAAV